MYTPPPNPIQGNSWINAPQLPHTDNDTPNQPIAQSEYKIAPVTQTTSTPQQNQTVHASQNTTSTDTQAKATANETQPPPQAVSDRSQTAPMSPRVSSVPTQIPLAPVVTQFQPLSQQAATFLPSRIKNVQAVVPSSQWRASPTSSAIAKPTQVISNSTAIPRKTVEQRSWSGRTIKPRERS